MEKVSTKDNKFQKAGFSPYLLLLTYFKKKAQVMLEFTFA